MPTDTDGPVRRAEQHFEAQDPREVAYFACANGSMLPPPGGH
jgi:hypothetical protein